MTNEEEIITYIDNGIYAETKYHLLITNKILYAIYLEIKDLNNRINKKHLE